MSSTPDPIGDLASALLLIGADGGAIDEATGHYIDHIALLHLLQPIMAVEVWEQLCAQCEICSIHIVDIQICADDDVQECRHLWDIMLHTHEKLAQPYEAQQCPECKTWVYVAAGPFAEGGDRTKPTSDWEHWSHHHMTDEERRAHNAPAAPGVVRSIGFPFFTYNSDPVVAVHEFYDKEES